MIRWEYRTVGALRDYELNKLGEQGWELVSAYAAAHGHSSSTYHVFKRPLDNGQPL